MMKPGLPWIIIILLGIAILPSRATAQAADSSLSLELLQRIEQLELEVRYLRGEMELYRHQLEKLQRQAAAAPASLPPAPSQAAPATAPSSPETATTAAEQKDTPSTTAPEAAQPQASTANDQTDFSNALSELRAGRFAEAITGFQNFLRTHPDSPLAGDAQYRLAESYAADENYQAAKEALIQLGLHHPQSPHLPDALLRLGDMYLKLGDTKRAQEVWEKLIQVYPDSQAARTAEQRFSAQ